MDKKIYRRQFQKDASMPSNKILRFRKSERHVHWAIAIPFMVCIASALILVVFYNPNPLRPYRDVFSWIHRLSGVLLFILPFVAMFKSRRDFRVYFYNIRQAWVWTMEDIKWLMLMGLAAVNKKIKLPEQGKFNAAEKINFMVLMTTFPLYILTGSLIWVTDGAFLSWMLHFGMALLALPLMGGHIFMATINPDTRKGLPGMISGMVDRDWAKHHYTAWYREKFEGITMKKDAGMSKMHDPATSPSYGAGDERPGTALNTDVEKYAEEILAKQKLFEPDSEEIRARQRQFETDASETAA